MSRGTFGGLLRDAERVLVVTGAGISTATGIPDYRGPRGVWRTRQPVTYQGFLGDPEARRRYWAQKAADWAAWGGRARPTPAHRALVELEEAGKLLLLVTQNVDGLHRAAGSRKLVEIHGTNAEAGCLRCGRRVPAAPVYRQVLDRGGVPTCERCGGWMKPATISFGQALRPPDLERSFSAAEACDLVVSLGSTLGVTPAADVPLAAFRRGVPYVVANRGPTAHDGLPPTLRLEGDLQDLVPEAVVETFSA